MKSVKRVLAIISVVCAVVVAFRVSVDCFFDKVLKLRRLKTKFYNKTVGGYYIDSDDGPIAILLSNKISSYKSFIITGILGALSAVFAALAFIIHIFSKNKD